MFQRTPPPLRPKRQTRGRVPGSSNMPSRAAWQRSAPARVRCFGQSKESERLTRWRCLAATIRGASRLMPVWPHSRNCPGASWTGRRSAVTDREAVLRRAGTHRVVHPPLGRYGTTWQSQVGFAQRARCRRHPPEWWATQEIASESHLLAPPAPREPGHWAEVQRPLGASWPQPEGDLGIHRNTRC